MINQNDGFYLNIGFKKSEPLGWIRQGLQNIKLLLTDNFFTRLPAHIFLYVQASKIRNEPTAQVKETYAKLKKAYEADKNLKTCEATFQLQDKFFIPARKALLELAFYIEQNKKDSKKRFGDESVEHAVLLLNCIEWKSKDIGSGKSYENIQRIYNSNHGIVSKPGVFDQNVNVPDEKTAKEYESKFHEMYSEMHEAFYEFRKEVVAHQNSIIRAGYYGLLHDEKVLSCHDRMMNLFNRFVDKEHYPQHFEMFEKMKKPEAKGN